MDTKKMIKESEKLTDRMFMTQMMMSFGMILLCMAMMCSSAFAYFSSSVSSATNTIQSASYHVSVTSNENFTETNGEYVLTYQDLSATTESGEEDVEVVVEENIEEDSVEQETIVPGVGVQIPTATYSFLLEKTSDSTASVGFVAIHLTCMQEGVEIASQTFYTEPIGTYIENGNTIERNQRVIGIEVPDGYEVRVKFVSEWGTCSYDGILTSSAISSMESIDNVQYVSLIRGEDYGVEIVDLTEALLAVNTNSLENPVDITDLTEDEIKTLVRNTLEVTLNGEVYEEFELLFEETLTLPEEGVLGVPVVVVYPGDEVTLRAEVQTIVYVEVMPDPVLTVIGNTIEYPVEVTSLDELEEAVRSVLEVYLDDVLINEYQIFFGEEFMLNEETVEEILVTVSVTVNEEEIQGSASVFVILAAQDDETPTDDTETDTESETPTDDTETDTEGETPTDDTETDTDGETPTDDTETDIEGETPTDDTETEPDGETPTDDTETDTDGETPTDDGETEPDGEVSTDDTETDTEGETPTDETETGTDGEVSVDETDTENTEENTDTETADVTEEPME